MKASIVEANHVRAERALAWLSNAHPEIRTYKAALSGGGSMIGMDKRLTKWECLLSIVTVGIYMPNRWIGTLWYSDHQKGATNRNWVLEVYGEGNMPTFELIAESLSEKFGVGIHVRLEDLKPRYHVYASVH